MQNKIRSRRSVTGRRIRAAAVAAVAGGLLAGLLGPVTPASATPARHGTSPDLDVLFVGAHPDDEAGRLSTYGQWGEEHDVKTGVITITRGEGGGNAVGPEEGPALGLIREAEERRAVGHAGITDVYNLDQVDFFYTVSAPLTEEVWGHDDTLERVIRVIRQTRPEVIMTMDPAPSPGNHGNHQYAGRMALEAYKLAGDRSVFPDQIIEEGLKPFDASKLLLTSARGQSGGNGSACPTTFTPNHPAQNIYGVWSGARSEEQDLLWAQIERTAQQQYASQGWASFPDAPADPEANGCDYFTQLESRVPFTRGDLSEQAADPTTILQGAVLPMPGGLPLGTGLEVSSDDFSVTPGGSTTVRVAVTAPKGKGLRDLSVELAVADPATGEDLGWQIDGVDGDKINNVTKINKLRGGQQVIKEFIVTAGEDAATNQRVLVSTTVSSGDRSGHGDTELEVVPAVRGDVQKLPQIADFSDYIAETDYPQLEGFVPPVLTLPSGGARTVQVTVSNFGEQPESGSVRLDLPDGFSAEPASVDYADLAPGEQGTVDFEVTNTDDSLPTSVQGGDYAYDVITTSSAGESTTRPALELVPATTIEEVADAPQLDGVITDGEYADSTLDLSRVWEGQACESAADCSATGHVVRHGDDLHIAVVVTDEAQGSVLEPSDCKRHWRTDSVEIAIDPDGRSENTATTFKALILPTTTDGEPCFGRDADHHRGGPDTAPGMDVASTVGDGGYVVETVIPASTLPGQVDPEHLGLNLFVYDSDTTDQTGQTRIGWSTWGGVQGDPYRWGVATLPGWEPPAVQAGDPVIPSEALDSLDSPQSIDQAVQGGVPVAGGPAADHRSTAGLLGAKTRDDAVRATILARGSGTAHLYALDADGAVVGSEITEIDRRGLIRATIPVEGRAARLLLGYAADSGGTTSSATRVR